jgi:hypothetical protein
MDRAAIVIGVNKASGMAPLTAAASAAASFANWANRAGFNVTLITDKRRAKVTAKKIKDAVKSIVEARTCSRLIVYFSGHGYLKGPDSLFWMLSDVGDDPNEAVNLGGSIWSARDCGIRHLVFISDACQTVLTSPKWLAVTGSVIFGTPQRGVSRPEVDVFYATRPGESAYEVPRKTPSTSAAKRYRAIFTDCLLDVLTHPNRRALAERTKPLPKCWVATCYRLKRHLENHVPRAAARENLKLVQEPDIRVESHLPNCLAEYPKYEPPRLAKGAKRVG